MFWAFFRVCALRAQKKEPNMLNRLKEGWRRALVTEDPTLNAVMAGISFAFILWSLLQFATYGLW